MVDKAAQTTDLVEMSTLQAGDTNLVDMQAYKDAARLAQGARLDAQQKSEGKIQSKTLESFPKFSADFLARPVQMPKLGRDDNSIKMPQIGGTDSSIKMPDGDVRAIGRVNAADILDAETLSEFKNAFKTAPLAVGEVSIRSNQEVVKTERTEAGHVTRTFKDGITETQHRDGTLSVRFPDNSGYMIFKNGEMLVRDSNGNSEHFDKDGNLTERNQNLPDDTTLGTDAMGRAISVRDVFGTHSAEFEYDTKGDLVKITGSLGEWTRQTDSDGTVFWVNQQDPSDKFDGELSVDSDGNIHATPNDRNAQKTVILRNGKEVGGPDAASGLVDEKVDEKGNIDRKVYHANGRLMSHGVTDEEGSRRYDYDEQGKLAQISKFNKKDGSWEQTEFGTNGNRTIVKRGDGRGNSETITCDPATGKEVASDIKFKDGSTMHVTFDADGNVKEISSKDANGTIRQWNRDSENPGATVKDTTRSGQFEDGGVSKKVIKFPDGFKIQMDFGSSGNYASSIWTSDNDVKGVRNPKLASIKR